MGYRLAGFDVTGVDIHSQKNYPFKFYQAHALTFLARHGKEFDLIHASPPCQAYSLVSAIAKETHPELLAETREALIANGVPYVIENVERAPLNNPILLCGLMFGLRLYRHRLFECSFPVQAPPHPEHIYKLTKLGRKSADGEVLSIVGHFIGVPTARKAMGISWMTQKELAQAIPPAYTSYIAESFLNSKMP